MSHEFEYFAYGSNMLTRRLQARTPSARVAARGYIEGYRLTFDKVSHDGSGKCNITVTGKSTDIVHGVLFRIDVREKKSLDAAEGLGKGYQEGRVRVVAESGVQDAITYIADRTDSKLVPYDWYKELVTAGAEQHELPKSYIASLRSVEARQDTDAARVAENQAIITEFQRSRVDQQNQPE